MSPALYCPAITSHIANNCLSVHVHWPGHSNNVSAAGCTMAVCASMLFLDGQLLQCMMAACITLISLITFLHISPYACINLHYKRQLQWNWNINSKTCRAQARHSRQARPGGCMRTGACGFRCMRFECRWLPRPGRLFRHNPTKLLHCHAPPFTHGAICTGMARRRCSATRTRLACGVCSCSVSASAVVSAMPQATRRI